MSFVQELERQKKEQEDVERRQKELTERQQKQEEEGHQMFLAKECLWAIVDL